MSGDSLDRQSLPAHMAERLERDISHGVWTGFLPGYRTLSQHYAVSDRTSKLAISLLEKQGVIAPTQPGKKRKILRSAKQTLKDMRLLIITDSMMPMEKADDELLHDIAVFWLKRGKIRSEVHRASGDLCRYKRPGKLLKQWVDQHHATHLLFFTPPSSWVKAVIALGLPCYYLGGELSSVNLRENRVPGSSLMWNFVFAKVLNRLKDLGHRKLLFPLELARGRNPKSLQNTLFEAYEGELSREDCEAFIPVFPEFDAESWLRYWKREFTTRKPTAVIVINQFALQSLYVFCARYNIKPGKDLSVVCMHWEEIFDWYSPRPTCLKFPYQASVQDFKSWVRSGCPQRKHQFLQMDWCGGSTCGKPAE